MLSAFLGIAAVIVAECWPLLRSPKVELISDSYRIDPTSIADVLFLGADEKFSFFFTLNRNGSANIFDKQHPKAIITNLGTWLANSGDSQRTPPKSIKSLKTSDGKTFVGLANDNNFFTFNLSIHPQLGESPIEIRDLVPVPITPNTEIRLFDFAKTSGYQRIAFRKTDQSLTIISQKRTNSLNPSSESTQQQDLIIPQIRGSISALLFSNNGRVLLVATARGELFFAQDVKGKFEIKGSSQQPDSMGMGIEDLILLSGGQTVVAKSDRGGLSSWSLAHKPGDNQQQLVLLRTFEGNTSANVFERTIASPRTRHFLSLADSNDSSSLNLFYSTTGAKRSEWRTDTFQVRHAIFASNGPALALLGASGVLQIYNIDDPYPEISLSALFWPQHYEGYAAPSYVWQSSGGSDLVEPKFSLVPLIFGTLKAMALTLIISVPLAICAALYSAQFASARLRRIIKPSVEFLAAIPSVVLGLLAALWIGPLLSKYAVSLALLLPCIIIFVLITSAIHTKLRMFNSHKNIDHYEVPFAIAAVCLGVLSSHFLGQWLSEHWFNGDFGLYIDEHFGLSFDQRSSLCVALALSLAVIPIIFAIAEDCIAAVPSSMRAAALALGASPWTTAMKVILPAAMPGVFSAIMIGLGRAVGETMIVLMASGNTPLMSGSPFQGLRALSANLAIELPEAAYGSSLYRTLFLSAFVLFLFTFVVNTLGEIVRLRMRKQFGTWA